MFRSNGNNPRRNDTDHGDDLPIAYDVTPMLTPYVTPSPAPTAPIPSPYVTPIPAPTGINPPGSHSGPDASANTRVAIDTSRGEKKKDKKKKKKKDRTKMEPQTSVEAVLVPPPSTKKKKHQKKQQDQNSNVVLLSERDIVPIPAPFLFPTGTMHLSDVVIPESTTWKLSKKLSKGCEKLVANNASETKRHRQLKIPVSAAETVVYVCAKKGNNFNVLAETIENNSLSNLSITRNHRSAILTRGTVQLKGYWTIPTCFVFGKNRIAPNITISLFDLRGIHVGNSSNNAVIIAFRHNEKQAGDTTQEYEEQPETIRYAIYQTPEIGRFIVPLAQAVVAAYSSVPRWAIPITWSGNLPPLPATSQQEAYYSERMGRDGGFSSAIYAAALAYHLKHKLNFAQKSFDGGQHGISSRLMKQQPRKRFPARSSGPHLINPYEVALGVVSSLTTALIDDVKADLIAELVLAGLNALSFNLVFRKLKLPKIDRRNLDLLCSYRNALGRALMYNVSLREVDFDLTVLTGFGETIGYAWAMNAQPLVSRINFSGCRLTENDLLGLLRGLARIWCGGTALAESIRMANNLDISTKVWDIFFQTFLDPSSLWSGWPQKSPPPPTLSFLQELDIRDTKAVGPGLVQIAEKLTGLRSLKLSSSGRSSTVSDVLSVLSVVNAPLERLEGNDFDASCIEGLFLHHRTFKEITLIGFIGDASPLFCNWPQAVPKLSIDIGKQFVPGKRPWAPPSGYGYSPGAISLGNSSNFSIYAMQCLANRSEGLKKLVIYDTFYWQLVDAMHTLADSGLEILHIYPPKCTSIENKINKLNSINLSRVEVFWKTLARSKTLRDLRCRNQLLGGRNSYEVAMVGRFLKSNRSVQRIWFDHEHLVLNLEDVKVLRSAFYGNKKVVEMEHLSKAKVATMEVFKQEISEQLRLVQNYKYEIKMLFKRAYSKHNRRWRDGPNRTKMPWVEKICVAKRKIGRLNREQDKIASLLGEIIRCITINQGTRAGIEEQKASERINRRQPQLKQLATKKKKFVTNLVTKLRKAKIRGRQQNSTKMQLPRSTYYQSRHIWPSNNRFRSNHHSYYSCYNDPYYARYHPHYGHYDHYDDDSSNNSDNGSNTESHCDWLGSLYEGTSCESEDPWANVDSLIQELEADYNCAMNPEYLASVHEECSELGIDVVEDVSRTLDTGAAVADKMDEIGTSMNVPNGMLTAVVDSSLEEQFDLAAIDSTLPDIPAYGSDASDFGDMDDIMDADDAVGMYAGAGPRDLDDGGPSFGGSNNAALAGARRRARARKKNRSMNRVREKTNRRLKVGYQNLSITGTSPIEIRREESVWPDNIVSSWAEEAKMQQIKAMAEIDMFDLPDVSSKSNSLLTEWLYSSIDKQLSHASIEVVLVTQCSIDRLPNLQAQLARWTGKASIAVYLKPTENKLDSIDAILSTIEEAKAGAGNKNFDVAVTLVEGCIEEELYPINYLRNVALLEAQKQHLRFNTSLDKSSTLLVDVDFRPSTNLYKMLHSKSASKYIMKERKVVVCPAFESTTTTCPTTIASLKELVDKGQTEGFHQSHFPLGHGPTQFDTFWEKSVNLLDTRNKNMEDYFWNESYSVRHEELFEPYVVMASIDVPLYDERFQGYGLNKVSHLARVSREKKGEFLVLPGVFLIAPAHERSEAWVKIYGNSQSDDNKFNQLYLKGLYYKFMKNLENGDDSVVSENTRSMQQLILNQERESKQSQEALNESIQSHEAAHPKGEYILCY